MSASSAIRSRIAAYENISTGSSPANPVEPERTPNSQASGKPAIKSEEVDLSAARSRLKKTSSTDARSVSVGAEGPTGGSSAATADSQAKSSPTFSGTAEFRRAPGAVALPGLTRIASGSLRSPPLTSPKPTSLLVQNASAQGVLGSGTQAGSQATHPLDSLSKQRSLNPEHTGGSQASSAAFLSARASPVHSPQIEQRGFSTPSSNENLGADKEASLAPVLPARLPQPAAASSGNQSYKPDPLRVAPSLASLAPRPNVQDTAASRTPPVLQPKRQVAFPPLATLTKSPSAPHELRSNTLPPASKPVLPPRNVAPSASHAVSGSLPHASGFDIAYQSQGQGRLPQRSNTIAAPSTSASLDPRVRRVAPSIPPAFGRLPPKKRSNSDLKSLRKQSSHDSFASSRSSGGATNFSSLGLPVAGSQTSLRRSDSVSSSLKQARKDRGFPPIGLRRRREASDVAGNTTGLGRDDWLRSPIPRRYAQLFDNLMTAMQKSGNLQSQAAPANAGLPASVVRETWKLSRLSNPELAKIW